MDRMAIHERLRHLDCAVLAAVVDDDDFEAPVQTACFCSDIGDRRRNVSFLVVTWHDKERHGHSSGFCATIVSRSDRVRVRAPSYSAGTIMCPVLSQET